MTYSVLVFRQPAIREALEGVVCTLPKTGERAVVDTPCAARLLLRSREVDALIVGREFIEDVPEMLAVCANPVTTMTVLLAFQPSAADRARARLSDIDYVVDAAEGEHSVVTFLQREFQTYRRRAHRESQSRGPVARGIWVGNKTDREIVEMIAAGYSDRDIAHAVCLNHQTVRNHVSRILCESGARNRTHLAAIYLKSVCEGTEPFEAADTRELKRCSSSWSNRDEVAAAASVDLWR